MSKVLASDRDALSQFVQLSSVLTGYSRNELWGTGMAETYFSHVQSRKGAGKTRTQHMLKYTDDVVQLFNDSDLAPYARAIIRLWYLGQWGVQTEQSPLPPVIYSLTPNAYTQSLAWRAMGGHPMGARQQGYASWSVPPIDNGEG